MGRALLYGFLLLMAGFFLLPVYLVVLTALKEPARITLETVWQWPHPLLGELPHRLGGLPAQVPELRGPRRLRHPPLRPGGVPERVRPGQVALPGSGLLFALILFGMFIPYQSILIPLFQFMKSIGLYGSLFGLVLVHVIYGIPIVTLIFRNYYSEIPDELVEAARIDGAGFFGIFRHVILPLSVPAFVVVAIWQFTQIWNEFLFAVTLTRPESQPITVALAQLAGGEAVKWNLPMAGAILAALPTLLVYILLGRYFLRGLLAGSVKG